MAVLAVVAILASVVGAATAAPSRVVDRTVLCRTGGKGTVATDRFLQVHIEPRVGNGSPIVSVYNRSGPGGVSALARTGPGQTGGSGLVSISRARCVRTTVRAPLTANGLTGGETESGDHRVCEVPATILVRIRAVFAEPVEVAAGATLARGRIEAASLAVATKRKAPLVFATLDDASGHAAIFTSPSRCIGG